MRARDWKFATKLFALVGVLIAGLAAFAWVSHTTIAAVRIKGDAYQDIVRSKDLIADVLPPDLVRPAPEIFEASRVVFLQPTEYVVVCQ